MKKILVATDFSRSAHAATQSAIELGLQWGAEIKLFHLVEQADTSATTEDNAERQMVAPKINHLLAMKQMEKANRQMQRCLEPPQSLGLKISGDVDVADERPLGQAIADYAERFQMDLVVLGKTGQEENFSQWGSTADYLARHGALPILLLGRQPDHFLMQRLTLLSDCRGQPEGNFAELRRFLRRFQCNLQLLKVITPETFETTPQAWDYLRQFAKYYQLQYHSLHLFNDHDPEQGRLNFLRYSASDAGLLVRTSADHWTELAMVQQNEAWFAVPLVVVPPH